MIFRVPDLDVGHEDGLLWSSVALPPVANVSIQPGVSGKGFLAPGNGKGN